VHPRMKRGKRCESTPRLFAPGQRKFVAIQEDREGSSISSKSEKSSGEKGLSSTITKGAFISQKEGEGPAVLKNLCGKKIYQSSRGGKVLAVGGKLTPLLKTKGCE